jgi:hypothetical protein
MALKRHFTDKEKFGLTQEEIKVAEKYLRKNKTAGAVTEAESYKLYEMFLVGCTFYEIHQQYPQYPVAQIVLTAALRGWLMDREKMMGSLRDRVQAKVVKSVIEQVDFLTSMLSVSNAEHIPAMKKYVADPENNPKPDLSIDSIKEYKEVVDTLQKLVAGATSQNKKASPMFDTLKAPVPRIEAEVEEEDDAADLLAEIVK